MHTRTVTQRTCTRRSEFLYRERLGLAAADHRLIAEHLPAPAAPPSGSPFAVAWRNYLRSILKKGFWYRLSCSPSVTFYVSENKTLAGKEERQHEGEASGRKLAVVFFEAAPAGLVQRVNREGLALHPQLLTTAELLQACGFRPPPDPLRPASETELLLEAHYQTLDIVRLDGAVEPEAPQVHLYSLGGEVNAEVAFAVDLEPAQRTKMVLSRCIQRHEALEDGETLQSLWALPLAQLQARAEGFFPAPPPPAAAPPAGRGRGAKGRGRGGRGAGAAAPPAPPAPVVARGRAGKGRGRGRGR